MTDKKESDKVEVKPNETNTNQSSKENAGKKPIEVDPEAILLKDLQIYALSIEKGINTSDDLPLVRVLRKTTNIRKRLTCHVLRNFLKYSHSCEEQILPQLLTVLDKFEETLKSSIDMDIDKDSKIDDEMNDDSSVKPKEKFTLVPVNYPLSIEVQIYAHLLLTIFLIDKKQFELALPCANTLIFSRIQSFSSRRSLNPLSWKSYFYFSRLYEVLHRLEEIRSPLLSALRNSCLRHDDEGQVTLLNLLLRNFLNYKLVDQAEKLSSKASFNETEVSSNQYARFLYYQGIIKSIQLDYTDANTSLMQAGRKAPQVSAVGFRQSVAKYQCIVQLLMGDIPERSMFTQPAIRHALKPYLQLTQAVRVGDLSVFISVVEKHKDIFQRDGTFTLIYRLHHNVIKTGLRKINVAYSRIYLRDIAEKLCIEDKEDVESLVSKAIRDCVIEASINHEEGYMKSRENSNIYSSDEPLEQFAKRITFCLNLHNEAIKAMRYPDKIRTEEDQENQERLKQEAELVSALQDDFGLD